MDSDTTGPKSTRRKYLRFVGGATAAGAMVLSGCTSQRGDSGNDGNNSGNDGNNSGNDGNNSGNNGVLGVRRTYDINSLDPVVITTATETQICNNIYEKILEYEQGSMELSEGLASDWTINDDEGYVEFELQEGIQFHGDYGEVTAEDIVFHFSRLNNPDNGSPQLGYLEQMGFQEAEAVDDYTVRIHAEQALATIPYMAADDMGKIPSKDAVEEKGDEFGFDPIGAGPFKFDEFIEDEKTVLTAYDNYHRENLPNTGTVEILSIPEEQTAWSSFQAGEYEINKIPSSPRLEQFQNDDSVEISKAPGMITRLIGFNNTIEPFDERRVRQAMNYATNKQEIVDDLYPGMTQRATSVMAPSVRYHTDDVETYDYDPDRAAQLLEEAGYGDGFETDLFVPQISRFTEPAEVFQSQWSDIGVDVNIEIRELGTYTQHVFAEGADAPMFSHSNSQMPVPDLQMAGEFHSSNVPPSSNWYHYENEQVDNWLEEALQETDEDRRAELWGNIQQQINEDCPGIWIDHESIVYAMQDYVNSFQIDPMRRLELEYTSMN